MGRALFAISLGSFLVLGCGSGIFHKTMSCGYGASSVSAAIVADTRLLDVAGDSPSRVYVAGLQVGSQGNSWVAGVVEDGTFTRTDSDLSGTVAGEAQSLLLDADGSVYVSGYVTLSSVHELRWVIRRALSGSASWTTVFDTTASATASQGSSLIKFNGKIFASGAIVPQGNSSLQWVVKASEDGVTWSTVDSYYYPGSLAQAIAKKLVAGADGLYAIGYAQDANLADHWIVRKSADGISGWTTVDDFLPSGSGANARASTGTAGLDGSIYVGGWKNGSALKLVIRKISSAGVANVDIFESAGSTQLFPFSMVTDLGGTIYAAITAIVTTNSARGYLRASQDGSSWSTLEELGSADAFTAYLGGQRLGDGSLVFSRGVGTSLTTGSAYLETIPYVCQ